jgi:hypothetical protein
MTKAPTYGPPTPTKQYKVRGAQTLDMLSKHGPELISGLGTAIAMGVTGSQEFNKVPVPQPNRVTAEKQFLERVRNDADMAMNQRDYVARLQQGLAMGQGPGASSIAQGAYMDKLRATEQSMQRMNEINAKIDATEKGMNLEASLSAQKFNEENLGKYREMAFMQDTAAERFGRERTQALVSQLLAGTQAVGTTIENRRLAEAVSGDSEVLERMRKDGTLAKLLKLADKQSKEERG